MNIYDQAIESIDKLEVSKEYLFQPVLDTIIRALERAKKVEELLRLHKYYTDYNLFPSKVVERIKQLEEEMK